MISSSHKSGTVRRTASAGGTSAWRPDDLMITPRSAAAMQAPSTADLAAALRERDLSEAHAAGFEAGRREGAQAEQMRLRASMQAAEAALDVIRASEDKWTGTIEENIAAIAVAVAKHIVDREITMDAAFTERLVRTALNEFPIDQAVRIRVNPGDLAIIEAQGDRALAAVSGAPDREAHWVSDPRVAPGGCVVEGRDRIIDGRVDTALERTYRRLADYHG